MTDMNTDFITDDAFSTVAEASESLGKRAVVHSRLVDDAMKELSRNQYDAATTDARNVLLLAPAGTGKTRTLTTRYLWLLDQGIAPEKVLLCTFSNAAANELEERIIPFVTMKMEDLWIGTTHSIALKIVREHAKELGFLNVDTIIDGEQQEDILRRVMRDIRHPVVDTPNEVNSNRRILEFIEQAKNRLITPAQAHRDMKNGDLSWAAGVAVEDIDAYEAYERYKLNYDMIDYNDMLYLATRHLETDANALEKWRDMFSHVMVDEYQDLSSSQIRLLRNLVKPDSTSFYAAADDDQSIYGWRGSDLKATLSFSRYWPKSEILHLEENYRTPKSIFDHASALISHNAQRHVKKIRTRPDSTAFVRTIQKYDPASEKEAVFENMMEGARRMDIPPERMAILCRSNRICQEYASYFASRGVEVNLHESIRLNAEPIRALTSWMQLSTSADNPLLFEQLANYPQKLVSESFLLNLNAKLAREKQKDGQDKLGPIALVLRHYDEGKQSYIQPGTDGRILAERIIEVKEFIKDLSQRNGKPEAPFAKLAEHLGIIELASKSPNPEDHHIGHFMRLADDMVQQIGLDKTLASLTQLDLNAGRSGINIATMHSAKGLEYDIVALPGWTEGEFPSSRRRVDAEIEEERRLAYVAITRAKKLLILSWSGTNNRPAKPSRFLTEARLVG